MARYFAEIADVEAVGGKARSLARLAAAGLPTPAGFVITDELFRSLGARPPEELSLSALDAAARPLAEAAFPEGFTEELQRRVSGLGGALSVRSSFGGEDDPDAVSAGIYESRVKVAPAVVADAVRMVLASALGAGAVAYARSRGRTPAAAPVAVLVHAFVAGTAGAAALEPGAAPVLSPRPSRGAAAVIESALRSLSAQHGPIEVEWAAEGDAVTFLQMRPYRAPTPRAWKGLDQLPPEERQQWTWDAAHNPLPLSPAQAGLVALVDQHCRIGLRQRVLGGYLFYAPGGPPPPRTIEPGQAPAALAQLLATVDQRLARPLSLEQALALFVEVYEPLFGVIQPAARAGRRALEAVVDARALPALLAGVESKASERRRRATRLAQAGADWPAALADYLALFGDEAPVWDVVVPTYREVPEALAGSAAPPAKIVDTAPDVDARLLAEARAAVAVGEDDDWLYARVQAAVRRALLELAGRLRDVIRSYDDVFFLPLPLARRLAAGASPPPSLSAVVAAGRAAHQAALADPPAGPGEATAVLRGHGTGGRAVGRVWRHRRSGPVPSDAVLIADTILPTELPLIDAAALVTETGGPLGHVAAQARERGLPAVVGVGPAARALADGVLVLVDADRGLIIAL